MDKISQKHTKDTFIYGLSRLLERSSFYGIRALIVLYIVLEIPDFGDNDAIQIYGWFGGSLLVSKIIGALLGDLLIGNKKAIIIGGIIQAIGAFILSFPTAFGLYTGLSFVVIGSGLYSPNLISNFGKLYLTKPKLLDSAFTLLYFLVNIGSFISVLSIGFLSERYGFSTGFFITGILMLLSLLIFLASKENTSNQTLKHEFSVNTRVLNVSIVLILVGLFWAIYQISDIRVTDLRLKFSELSSLGFSKNIWTSIDSILILPICIIAFIFWSYFYNSQFIKLLLGFAFATISFGIIYLIPEIPSEYQAIIFLFSLFLFAISEIHIAPILRSIITKYSNPKYLAIIISLSFIPNRSIAIVFSLFNDKIIEEPELGLKFGILLSFILGLSLFFFIRWRKKLALI